jgi:hypothetical protein
VNSVGLVVLVGLLLYSLSGPSPSDLAWGVDPGKYEAGSTPMSFTEAEAYCVGKGYHLASIHSQEEQAMAATACAMQEIGTHWGDTERPNGCWIGLHVGAQEGVFEWTDHSMVDYLNFYSGEPNQCSMADLWDRNHCGSEGEKYVELQSNWGFAWNDNGLEGSHTHDVETQAARQAEMDANGGGTATNSARGMYPLCLKEETTEIALEGGIDPNSVVGSSRASTTWRLPKPSCRAYGLDGQVQEAVKDQNTGKWDCGPEPDGTKPNFILMPYTSSAVQAEDMCKAKGYAGLASLHSIADVRHAKELCGKFANLHKVIKGLPHSCWIGLSDKEQEGGFAWMDSTAVEYLNWSPGEPNEWGGEESGEDYVAMQYDWAGGAWNDANVLGEAGHAAMGSRGGHTMAQITGCHGCYGPAGYYPLCEEKRPHASQNGPWEWQTLTGAESGRFKVLPRSLPRAHAMAACAENGMHGLASIHSRSEQIQAAKVCRQVASVDAELQHGVAEGCWIGLTDEGLEGTFRWQDNSPTNFLNWNSGEPNECIGCGGEDGVEIDYRWGSRDGYEFGGGWNDANDFGRAGSASDGRNLQATHDTCWGCWGAVGYFPICQTALPTAEGPPEWRTPSKAGTCVGPTGATQPIQFQPGSNQYSCPMQAGYPQQAPHPTNCVDHQYAQYRFLIEAVRGEGAAEAPGADSTHAANSVQIAEFNFYGGPGKQAQILCNQWEGCTVTNPGGDNPQRGQNQCTYNQDTHQEECSRGEGLGSELPPMVVDQDANTKWLDFGMVRASDLAGTGQGSQLIFSGGALERSTVVGYSFVTANDAPERDPSSWKFQGCPHAGVCTEQEWVNLDIRRSYSAPNTRNFETHEFAVGCAGQLTQTTCTGETQAADQMCTPLPNSEGGYGSCASTGATCQGGVGADHHQRAFVALPKPESWDSARLLCKRNFGPHSDLASIHNPAQQAAAVSMCTQLTSGETLEGGVPKGCWIGLNDEATTRRDGLAGESVFSWVDRSVVDFISFAPGEPNNVGDNGEDVTEIDLRQGRHDGAMAGAWNDNNELAEAGNSDDMAGCYGCYGTFGNYPLCETHAPAAGSNELGHATDSSITCQIDQTHDYGQGGIGGKGCTGTYATCCMPPPPPPPPVTGAGQCTAYPPVVLNGAYTVTHLFGSSEATLTCNYGYTPTSYPSTISCTNDVWGQAGACVVAGSNGGRRALAEVRDEAGQETFANGTAKPVTAHPARVLHTINETKWLSAEELSDSDRLIMKDLDDFFGDKVYTWGCTASNALNYNPEATMEAGNCEYHEDQPHYTRMY